MIKNIKRKDILALARVKKFFAALIAIMVLVQQFTIPGLFAGYALAQDVLPSKCVWSELGLSKDGSMTWFLNTKYGVTESWCQNPPKPAQSVDYDSSIENGSFVATKYTAAVVIGKNPGFDNLGQSCGLDIVLVMDRSSSIDAAELEQQKDAFKGMIDELAGTPTEFAVVSFGNNADILQAFTADEAAAKNAIDSIDYKTGVATNWEDGLLAAQSVLPNRVNPDLIIFASDGDPTVNNGSSVTGGTTDGNDLVNAILAANGIKTDNVRILTLGVGLGVTQANLEAISSADAYYPVADYASLAAALEALASEFCGGTISLEKIIDVDGDTATTDDQSRGGSGWKFMVAEKSAVTGEDGNIMPVEVDCDGKSFEVSEAEIKAGYEFVGGVCNGAANNGTLDSNRRAILGIEIEPENIVACTFYNKPNCARIYSEPVCTGDGVSRVNYTYGNELCGAAGYEEGTESEECLCGYTDWTNAGCIRDGYRKQTRTQTTEYEYCTDLEQAVADDSCAGDDPVEPACGNGKVEGDEVCDGGTQPCSVGFYKGFRSCNSNCSGWDACQATESCGDGVRNGDEECDGGDNCTADCKLINEGPSDEPRCGSANAKNYSFEASGFGADTLCEIGTPSPAEVAFPAAGGRVNWNCLNESGNNNVSCFASRSAEPESGTSGKCGSADGNDFTSAPTENLCAAGEASTVEGGGPWTWSCVGSGGGSDARCEASKKESSSGTKLHWSHPGGDRARGVKPSVAGASIDLDEIERTINEIRTKIAVISAEVAARNGAVVGVATEVVTGVLD